MTLRTITTKAGGALPIMGVAVGVFALGVLTQQALAQRPATATDPLLDKAQVQDTIVDYYALFGGRAKGDFGAFFTDDGVLDANGVVRQGPAAINSLYKQIGGAEGGQIDILLTNLKVVVNGTTATAAGTSRRAPSPTMADCLSPC